MIGYDYIVAERLKSWLPDNSNLRVLEPDDYKQLFSTYADDKKDKNFTLPMIALERGSSMQLVSNVKQSRSFDGLRLADNRKETILLNVIPVTIDYKFHIYTKTYAESDEYVRQFLFKLINNPTLLIDIEYNGITFKHTTNMRIGNTVEDSSASAGRLYAGQFTRRTISIEMQDCFLFSLPRKQRWTLQNAELRLARKQSDSEDKDEIEGLDLANKAE